MNKACWILYLSLLGGCAHLPNGEIDYKGSFEKSMEYLGMAIWAPIVVPSLLIAYTKTTGPANTNCWKSGGRLICNSQGFINGSYYSGTRTYRFDR